MIPGPEAGPPGRFSLYPVGKTTYADGARVELGDRIALQLHVLADPNGLLAAAPNQTADALAAAVGTDKLEYRLVPDEKPPTSSPSDVVEVAEGRVWVVIQPAERRPE